MNKDINIHFMHERGVHFSDIAKKFGISPYDAALSYARIEELRTKNKAKEKVVYRKRYNKPVKSRTAKLISYMGNL